ncbi:IS66 family insertion sequence element accessory protein TnpB [Yanghanlia caeni]|uniref:IS66 family insertion sequence element accessory protein TnpB n=1 Tax=Yanghanlia caeni TaxID=3064283 RepID=A0ABU1DAN5_9BURK|nr:IS66 family insertion sequence element accessory protein TnpB [Alcaligenaceae bacterium LG-2]
MIGQVYLCCVPVDFRKQIDGLAALVQGELALDVFGNALFVFVNRQRSRIKILYWHRNGFCLWQKRLEKERFAWPSPGPHTTVTLSPKELEWLLEGFDLWANYPHKTLNYQSVM